MFSFVYNLTNYLCQVKFLIKRQYAVDGLIDLIKYEWIAFQLSFFSYFQEFTWSILITAQTTSRHLSLLLYSLLLNFPVTCIYLWLDVFEIEHSSTSSSVFAHVLVSTGSKFCSYDGEVQLKSRSWTLMSMCSISTVTCKQHRWGISSVASCRTLCHLVGPGTPTRWRLGASSGLSHTRWPWPNEAYY